MEDDLKLAKATLSKLRKEIEIYQSHCENCPIFNQQTNPVHFNHLSLQGQFQRSLEEHQTTNQLHLSQSSHHHNDLNGQPSTPQ